MAAAEKKLKPGPSPLILDLRKVRGFAKKGYTRKQIARMLGCSLAFFLRYEFPDDIRELLDQNGKDMITLTGTMGQHVAVKRYRPNRRA